MGPLDIDIRQFTVVPCHIEAGMAQQALQAEDVPSVSQEAYRGGVPQGMGTTADPADAGPPPMKDNPFPDMMTCHWQAVKGQEKGSAPGIQWQGPCLVQVPSEHLPGKPADRDEPFLTTLTQHLEYTVIEPQVVERQAAEFR